MGFFGIARRVSVLSIDMYAAGINAAGINAVGIYATLALRLLNNLGS